MLNDRTDLHVARLHEQVTWSRSAVVETLANLTHNLAAFGSAAPDMALKQLNQIVHRQGVVMAFADVFWALAALYAVLACFTFVMRRPVIFAPGGDAH